MNKTSTHSLHLPTSIKAAPKKLAATSAAVFSAGRKKRAGFEALRATPTRQEGEHPKEQGETTKGRRAGKCLLRLPSMVGLAHICHWVGRLPIWLLPTSIALLSRPLHVAQPSLFALLLATALAATAPLTNAASITDCTNATATDPDTLPCILDVDLGFGILDENGGIKVSDIKMNPRAPNGDPAKLWVRDGSEVAFFVQITFHRGSFPNRASGDLEFTATIYDHDNEGFNGVLPDLGRDDFVAIGLSRLVEDHGSAIERVLLGPYTGTLVRADGAGGGRRVQRAADGLNPATIIEDQTGDADFDGDTSPAWGANRVRNPADTLEIYAPSPDTFPFVDVPDPFGLIVFEKEGNKREWTRGSTIFTLTVVKEGETPPDGAIEIAIDEPPPSALFSGPAGWILWRNRGNSKARV